MKRTHRLHWGDCLFLLGSAMFFMGCVASGLRSGRTLDPGQSSLGIGYLKLSDEGESVDLISLEGRAGLSETADAGLMHTIDVTEGTDGAYSTTWADVKFQLSNRENVIGKPIVSLGLLKGYLSEDSGGETSEIHFTGLPLYLSFPASETVTPYFMYRYEVISEDFFPKEFDDPRHTVLFGVEVFTHPPVAGRWTPRLGIGIGRISSLAGGSGDGAIMMLNLGVGIDSPPRR